MLKKILKNIPRKERKKFYFLQIAAVFNAALELLMVLLMYPFLNLIFNNSNIPNKLVYILDFFKIDINDLNSITLIIISLFVIINFLNLINNWLFNLFSHNVGAVISQDIFEKLISSNYEFIVKNKNSNLINNLIIEITRFSNSVLVPLTNINTRIFSLLFIFIGINFINYKVSISIAFLLVLIYFLIYKIFKNKLEFNGLKISFFNNIKISTLNSFIYFFKDIKLQSIENIFKEKFKNSTNQLAQFYSNSQILGFAPKYFIETFFFILILLVFLFINNNNEISNIDYLPLVGVYALVGYRSIPYFQQIYNSYATLKSNLSSLQNIDKLRKSIPRSGNIIFKKIDKNNNKLILKKIYYKVGGYEILKNINMQFNSGKIYAISGINGSGKTTLANIISGLIQPTKGSIIINNKILRKNERISMNDISYILQEPGILDDTLLNNIFIKGEDSYNQVDLSAYKNLINKFNFNKKIINKKFKLGDNGKLLSGGQRQKVSILRGLVKSSKILILDEFSNSLDEKSIKILLEYLNEIKKNKIIILISHNNKILKHSDFIYNLKK